MFSKKRNIEIKCDTFIDLYNSCNIGCKHCKFQDDIKNIKEINIDYSKYFNKKILFCYSVDPYPYGFNSIVKNVVEKLHQQNCDIVFLTRRASELYKDLEVFSKKDYIGISLSENCLQNSNDEEIKTLYLEAKKRGLKTWMSLEPIYSEDYANEIITKYGKYIDFIRVGKDDKKEYDYDKIKTKIIKNKNVYIK